jgi:hypothetical protein
MELAVADVERNHAPGARLEEAVGEAPGGGAHVETVAAAGLDAERLQCVRELLAAAGDEPRRPLDVQLGPFVDLSPGLVVPRDETGENERLRLASGLGQAALDERYVEPFLDPGKVVATEGEVNLAPTKPSSSRHAPPL